MGLYDVGTVYEVRVPGRIRRGTRAQRPETEIAAPAE